MERIKREDIDRQVDVLNNQLEGKGQKARFYVGRANGAYRLENESGSKSYLVGMTAREMYDCLRAMNALIDEIK